MRPSQGLAASSGDARFAWDSYRRFIQMYADVVLGLDHDAVRRSAGNRQGRQRLSTSIPKWRAEDWQALVGRVQGASSRPNWGKPFPQDVHEQLWGAIGAVFGCWESERAKVYRRLNAFPRTGARRSTCRRWCSAIWAILRPPASPSPAIRRPARSAYYGEWLINAQGEDVVAGIRTPQYLTRAAREAGQCQAAQHGRGDARSLSPSWRGVFDMLETHYRDMQDIEFTVERGKLWMLQTRSRQAHRQGGAEDRGRYGRARG